MKNCKDYTDCVFYKAEENIINFATISIKNYVKSAYWTLYITRNIGGPSIYFGF